MTERTATRPKPLTGLLLLAALAGLFGAAPAAAEEPSPRERFIQHLRENFDDIHDVSMRFHRTDPSLGGLILLEMQWEGGALQSSQALRNDTGSDELAAALGEAIGKWEIPGIAAAATIKMPFRIKIVGHGDPAFAERAILTGQVLDRRGRPVFDARIVLRPPKGDETEPLVARTNREGVYVLTLIPPGTWKVTCELHGVEQGRRKELTLASGEHQQLDLTVRKR